MDSGEGAVMVITGGSSGIGRAAAAQLAAGGATVVVAARDPVRGAAVVDELGAPAELVTIDLASFRSIHAGAAELVERFARIDVLVNNAGVILSERRLTEEGFEATFGTNHLGHFLLTSLLLERMAEGAAARGRPARIVNVASLGHRMASRQVLEHDPLFERHPYDGWQAYFASKLANVAYTLELARRLDPRSVTANCLHPGFVATGWGRGDDTRGVTKLGITLSRPFQIGPDRAARTVVHLAASPEVEGVSGGYFVRRRRHRPSAAAADPALGSVLWDASERLVAEGEGRATG
jgi:retinol dehydrogenase-12